MTNNQIIQTRVFSSILHNGAVIFLKYGEGAFDDVRIDRRSKYFNLIDEVMKNQCKLTFKEPLSIQEILNQA